MALRTPNFVRTMSTKPPRTMAQVLSPGASSDTSGYTSTGGSGDASTILSSSLEEASKKAIATYRTALRDIPEMRRNFSIMEDGSYVAAVIRDNFERHKGITDPKIVDMLVFKASQELGEIRQQWKSRHHVYGYIHRYADKILREELAKRSSSSDSNDQREKMLADWRNRGLVPAELLSWPMFSKWKADEDMKFRNFALDNKLFSAEQLERGSAQPKASCTIM